MASTIAAVLVASVAGALGLVDDAADQTVLDRIIRTDVKIRPVGAISPVTTERSIISWAGKSLDVAHSKGAAVTNRGADNLEIAGRPHRLRRAQTAGGADHRASLDGRFRHNRAILQEVLRNTWRRGSLSMYARGRAHAQNQHGYHPGEMRRA